MRKSAGRRFSGAKSPETFCNCTLSKFNLRSFPTILRGLEKDDFCTYKDNGSWYFDTEDEDLNF